MLQTSLPLPLPLPHVIKHWGILYIIKLVRVIYIYIGSLHKNPPMGQPNYIDL